MFGGFFVLETWPDFLFYSDDANLTGIPIFLINATAEACIIGDVRSFFKDLGFVFF
jgi:hypothetical protein